MLQSTDTLTQQVDVRNCELRDVEQSVGHLQSADDLETVQGQLLRQITTVIESNRKLEDDLLLTRFELQQQAIQLDETKREARMDKLSGVANRKGFDEHLAYLMGRRQTSSTRFGLILCDVDHFKWINDTHGHAAGDRVVSGVGELLSNTVRPGDLVARFGGDEFAIILKVVDLESAKLACERIRQVVEQSNFSSGDDDSKLAVTFSLGLAFPTAEDTIESLMQRADQALYQAKKNGRNQMSYSPADTTADTSC